MWLFGQLGQRMGFKEACFRDTHEQIIKQALAIGPEGHSTNPGMEHITFEDLKQQGHIPLGFHRDPEAHPFQPDTAGTVPTPSGKIEFYSEELSSAGRDPPPAFVPNTESRLGNGAVRFPLEFLGRKADNYMNSTFANLDGHRKMEARTGHALTGSKGTRAITQRRRVRSGSSTAVKVLMAEGLMSFQFAASRAHRQEGRWHVLPSRLLTRRN